ncbi:hypothetical protein CP533_0024 [Ophiocordyceps camponoti-saundersi (nom. inval.)]|nr:hypothetical protein CP533_0024 [Ophiocordyceps camponoti-saundersi (nom. inval.)]
MRLISALFAIQTSMLATAKPYYPGDAPDLEYLLYAAPQSISYADGLWIGARDRPLCYISPRNVRGHVGTGFASVTTYDGAIENEHFLWAGAGKVHLRKRQSLRVHGQCKEGERQFGLCGPGCACCIGGHAWWIDEKPPFEPRWSRSCNDGDKTSCTEIDEKPNPPELMGQFVGSEDDPWEITLDPFGHQAVRFLNASVMVKDNDGQAWLGDRPLHWTMTGSEGAWEPEKNCGKGTFAIGTNQQGVVACLKVK